MHWLIYNIIHALPGQQSIPLQAKPEVSFHRPAFDSNSCQMAFSLQSPLSEYIHNFRGWQLRVIFYKDRYLSWFWNKCCPVKCDHKEHAHIYAALGMKCKYFV